MKWKFKFGNILELMVLFRGVLDLFFDSGMEMINIVVIKRVDINI